MTVVLRISKRRRFLNHGKLLTLDTLNYKVKGMHLTVETLESNRLINIIGLSESTLPNDL